MCKGAEGMRAGRAQARRTIWTAAVVAASAWAAASPAWAQRLRGTRKEPLSKETICVIRAALDDGRLEDVPKLLFGETFDRDLADLVVYFDGCDRARIQLTQAGEKKEELWGARAVWVLVFTGDSKIAHAVADTDTALQRTLKGNTKRTTNLGSSGESKHDTLTLKSFGSTNRATSLEDEDWTVTESYKDSRSVRVEALDYRQGAGESSILKGLGALFGVAPESGKKAALGDTSMALRMRNIADDGTLYFDIAKVRLEENASYRVRVRLGGWKAYATFANYEASWLGIGIGPVVSRPRRLENGPQRPGIAPFFFFHYYLFRPKLPQRNLASRWGDRSWSLVLGGEIAKKLQDIFAGTAVGHLVGPLGLCAGVHFHPTENDSTPKAWWVRPAFGMDYTF